MRYNTHIALPILLLLLFINAIYVFSVDDNQPKLHITLSNSIDYIDITTDETDPKDPKDPRDDFMMTDFNNNSLFITEPPIGPNKPTELIPSESTPLFIRLSINSTPPSPILTDPKAPVTVFRHSTDADGNAINTNVNPNSSGNTDSHNNDHISTKPSQQLNTGPNSRFSNIPISTIRQKGLAPNIGHTPGVAIETDVINQAIAGGSNIPQLSDNDQENPSLNDLSSGTHADNTGENTFQTNSLNDNESVQDMIDYEINNNNQQQNVEVNPTSLLNHNTEPIITLIDPSASISIQRPDPTIIIPPPFDMASRVRFSNSNRNSNNNNNNNNNNAIPSSRRPGHKPHPRPIVTAGGMAPPPSSAMRYSMHPIKPNHFLYDNDNDGRQYSHQYNSPYTTRRFSPWKSNDYAVDNNNYANYNNNYNYDDNTRVTYGSGSPYNDNIDRNNDRYGYYRTFGVNEHWDLSQSRREIIDRLKQQKQKQHDRTIFDDISHCNDDINEHKHGDVSHPLYHRCDGLLRNDLKTKRNQDGYHTNRTPSQRQNNEINDVPLKYKHKRYHGGDRGCYDSSNIGSPMIRLKHQLKNANINHHTDGSNYHNANKLNQSKKIENEFDNKQNQDNKFDNKNNNNNNNHDIGGVITSRHRFDQFDISNDNKRHICDQYKKGLYSYPFKKWPKILKEHQNISLRGRNDTFTRVSTECDDEH